MIDHGTPTLNHKVLEVLNTGIGERLKRNMGQEAPLPANLQRLMFALAAAD
ncbi:hypothetical protein AB8A28_24915 [Tardiphaga sp. 71_E8_N1_1]|uniref:hypothetical protein n=1 Tax=Tardiphaga sp. 71_E8_N1_1 TaxID=3240784 RepID=UPI003F899074